jgi:ankyrin repeat protein
MRDHQGRRRIVLCVWGKMPDAVIRQGETALMKAAQVGHLDVVRLLLENEANAGILDFTGRTALDHADQNRHRAIVKMLRENS